MSALPAESLYVWAEIVGMAISPWLAMTFTLRRWTLFAIALCGAAVFFDDGAADRQSHAHAAGFCREEWLEQLLEVVRAQAGTRVPHRDVHLFLNALGTYTQFTDAVSDDHSSPEWR
jgi:hypothetical protein